MRSKCDKGYETANGCLAHGMKRYYGGLIAEPQGVTIKDNSTGVFGFGRSSDHQRVAGRGFDLRPDRSGDLHRQRNAGELQGRGGPGRERLLRGAGDRRRRTAHRLHRPALRGPGRRRHRTRRSSAARSMARRTTASPTNSFGLRQCLGADPAGATDFFSLDQSGNTTGGDWRKVFSGASTYKDNFAAGTAFIVIRRSDAKGLQLSKPGDHAMVANVQMGMSGWVWTSPGARVVRPAADEPGVDRRQHAAARARPPAGRRRHDRAIGSRRDVLRRASRHRRGGDLRRQRHRSWSAPAARRSSNSAACCRRRSPSATGSRKC